MRNARTWLVALVVMGAAGLGGCGDKLADNTLSVDLSVEVVTPTLIPSQGGIEVTIVGRNFDAKTQVLLEGEAPLGVAVRSENRITFVAPARTPGNAALEVIGGNGQQVEVSPPLRYFAEQIAFGLDTPIALPDNLLVPEVWDYRLADLDGDGFDDLLVNLRRREGDEHLYTLRTLRNVGDGRTFTALDSVSDLVQVIAVLDVNGDGRADLIDAHRLFLAGGNGTFQPPTTLVEPGETQAQVLATLVADLDGDGHQELAWISGGPLGQSRAPTSLVIAKVSPAGEITVQRVVDNLGFDARQPYYQGQGLVAADLDQDGAADLAFAAGTESTTPGQYRVAVRLGPTFEQDFSSVVVETWAEIGYSLDLVDADGDGLLDLFSIDSDGMFPATIARGDGRGAFGVPAEIGWPCEGYPAALPRPASLGAGKVLLGCEGGLLLVSFWKGLVREREEIPYGCLGELNGRPEVDLLSREGQAFRARYRLGGRLVPRDVMTVQPPALVLEVLPQQARVLEGRFGAGGLIAVAGNWATLLAPAAGEGEVPVVRARYELGADPGKGIGQAVVADLDGDEQDELVVRIAGGPAGTADRLQVFEVRDDRLVAGAARDLGQGRGAEDLQWYTLLAGNLSGQGRGEVLALWADPPSAWSPNTAALFGQDLQPSPVTFQDGALPTSFAMGLMDLDGDGRDDLWQKKLIDVGGALALVVFWNDLDRGQFVKELLPLPMVADPDLESARGGFLRRADGTIDLWVWVGTPGGSLLGLAGFSPGDPIPTSRIEWTDFAGQGGAVEFIGADFDGSGDARAALVTYEAWYTLTLTMLGRSPAGQPVVGDAFPFDALGYLSEVEVSDWNGDGLADLILPSVLIPGGLFFVENTSR